MNAPEGSVTWPDMVPLLMDCPNTSAARQHGDQSNYPQQLHHSIIADCAFSDSTSWTSDAAIIDLSYRDFPFPFSTLLPALIRVRAERPCYTQDNATVFHLTTGRKGSSSRWRWRFAGLCHKAEYERRRRMAEFLATHGRNGRCASGSHQVVEQKNSTGSDGWSLKQAIDKVQEFGCLVKDLDIGLIDFPTLFQGEEVYLCWKTGRERYPILARR